MSLVEALDFPLFHKLLFTFGHFLWQGTAIAFLLACLWPLVRRMPSNKRYGLLVACLLLMAVAPVITFAVLQTPPEWRTAHGRGSLATAVLESGGTGAVQAQATESLPAADGDTAPETAAVMQAGTDFPFAHGLRPYAPYLAAAYILGFGLMVVRLLLSLRGAASLLSLAQPLYDTSGLAVLAAQARKLGLHATPAIASCRKVVVPTVIGVLRPTILLPVAMATGLRPEQVAMLLTHELAHIRRYDHLVNLMQRCIETVLFFHPAVWLVSWQIRIEREFCCDDAVLAAGAHPASYATLLLEIAERSRLSAAASSVMAIGALDRPSQLRCRILRLTDGGKRGPDRLSRRGHLSLSGLAVVVFLALFWPLCRGEPPAAGGGAATERTTAADEKESSRPQKPDTPPGKKGPASGRAVSAEAPRKPELKLPPAVSPAKPEELGPVSIDRLRNVLSETAPSFAPSGSTERRYADCEVQRRRTVLGRRLIEALEGKDLEPADRAELAEMKKELLRRLEPILYHYLRTVDQSVPTDFRGYSREQMDSFKVMVHTAIGEGEFFVRTYPMSKWSTEVRYYLGRLLFLNIEVHLAQRAEEHRKETGKGAPATLRATWRKAYLNRVSGLLETVRNATGVPGELQQPLAKLWADVLIRDGRREEGARHYTRYVRAYPKASDVASGLVYIMAAQQFLYAEKPAEAEKILKQALALGDAFEYHPHVIEFYFKALTALGKLEEAEALWLTWGPRFVERSRDRARSAFQRDNYKTFSESYQFYLGYVNFALGRFERAKDCFREHLETVGARKGLNPRTTVFLQRSTKLLEVLEEQIGTTAQEIDLQGLWAGNKTFSLAQHKGKVIALCFRSYGAARVHPCLEYLQRMYEEHGRGEGPFVSASIAYLKGADAPDQLLTLAEEGTALDLTYPLGLDPSPKRELFTQQYRVNVGSATLVIIDPLGRIVYYEQDPRPNAFGLFTRVIDRLLGA